MARQPAGAAQVRDRNGGSERELDRYEAEKNRTGHRPSGCRNTATP
jgi:hypothetical protein